MNREEQNRDTTHTHTHSAELKCGVKVLRATLCACQVKNTPLESREKPDKCLKIVAPQLSESDEQHLKCVWPGIRKLGLSHRSQVMGIPTG